MKKKIKFILLIAAVCVLVGAILIGAASVFTDGGMRTLFGRNWSIGFDDDGELDIDFGGKNSGLNGEYSVSNEYVVTDKVNAVSIDWAAGGVTVKAYDGDEIRFSESSAYPLTQDDSLRWSVNGKTLTIKYVKTNIAEFNLNGNHEKMLEVLLPADIAENLNTLEISTGSADISVSDVSSVGLDLDTASGTVNLANAVSTELKIDTSSGDILIENTSAQNISLETASGAISGCFNDSGKIEAESASGEINITGDFTSIETSSSSGDTSLTLLTYPRSAEIDTSSGSVTLCVPADGGFTLNTDTGSGEFISEVPVKMHGSSYVYGNGSCKIEVDTASGDITLNAAYNTPKSPQKFSAGFFVIRFRPVFTWEGILCYYFK